MHLCVLRGSHNKQRFFLYTALIDWFLKPRQRVFSARYELDLEIRQYSFVLKGLMLFWGSVGKTKCLMLNQGGFITWIILRLSSYRAVNALVLGYKKNAVNSV